MRSARRVSTRCAAPVANAVARHDRMFRNRGVPTGGLRSRNVVAPNADLRTATRGSARLSTVVQNEYNARRFEPRTSGGRACDRGQEALMIAVVWQFEVKNGLEHEFEEFLGANG